ncbi:hypothetical protein M501DRAFT_1019751 [Patellaria atrata CBS 101060]|uniref:ATPase AAA-type core domain-containing protein n=1 Tax=Patellaria atrata CBS 101060 TaxID=1346257 RepID=A0A9P4S5M2_9PEZI|nr:hypothetical protein M501DRAFT_1019751 [Patellaria atrata CBS 101060]
MARQIGDILNVDTTVVDCAQMRNDWDLFGAHNGYQRSEEGSQLNNFLATNSGLRSVVFLDEFDKTSQKIRNSLLLLCDTGDYYDMRTNTPIDCSMTILIVVTNLGDAAINAFYDKEIEPKNDTEKSHVSLLPLQEEIGKVFTRKFGFADEIRKPIDLRPEVKRLIGNSYLYICDDEAITKKLAKDRYCRELNARSLFHAVNNLSRDFLRVYCSSNETLTEEMNTQGLMQFVMEVKMIRGGFETIVINRAGITNVAIEDDCPGAVGNNI